MDPVEGDSNYPTRSQQRRIVLTNHSSCRAWDECRREPSHAPAFGSFRGAKLSSGCGTGVPWRSRAAYPGGAGGGRTPLIGCTRSRWRGPGHPHGIGGSMTRRCLNGAFHGPIEQGILPSLPHRHRGICICPTPLSSADETLPRGNVLRTSSKLHVDRGPRVSCLPSRVQSTFSSPDKERGRRHGLLRAQAQSVSQQTWES